MTASSFGTKNEPKFADADAPDVALNPTQVAAYAAKVGNRRVGTTTERNAATGADVWEGLLWGDTTTGLDYRRVGDVWVTEAPLVSSLAGVGVVPTGKRLITKIGVWSGAQFNAGTSPQVFEGAFPTKCAVIQLTMQGGPHTSVSVFADTLSAAGLTLASPGSYTGGAAIHYVAYGW